MVKMAASMKRIMALMLTALILLCACEKDYEPFRLEPGGGVWPQIDSADALRLAYEPEPFEQGSKASLSVIGRPDTEYTLQVFLSSGESAASGLGAALSDGEGAVSWTWNIGAATKPGTYQAYITGGDDRLLLYIEIAEKG
ncbi:MAG: hypothetical protein LBS19_11780 [Clostridiales bacterium]|jgi:hypothetical protein|nr:hypothetical protein [Clostridiales bacterium]